MFRELMPLLKERSVLVSIARESDQTIRATVIPKRLGEGENAALATPLSFVGTPEELEQEFPRALNEYVETHQRLSTTLAQAKAEMDAAAKAAQEEARRKSEERRKAKTSMPVATTSNAAEPPTPPPPKPAAPAGDGLPNAGSAEAVPGQCKLSL